MRCSKCKQDVQPDKMICICGEPFYLAKIPCNNFYLTPTLKIPIEFENKGLDPFIVCELIIDDKPNNIDEQLVKPGRSTAYQLSIPQDIGLGKHCLSVRVYFQGKRVELPPFKREIILNPFPELYIMHEEVLKLYPSKDFKVEIKLKLGNSDHTSCKIGRISLVDLATQGLLSQATPNILLDRNKAEDSIELQFPKDIKPGSYNGEIIIEDVNQILLLSKNLPYEYYQVPKVELEIGKWGNDEFKFNPIKARNPIYWRAPAYTSTDKRIHLESISKERFTEVGTDVTLFSDIAYFKESKFVLSGGKTLDLEISKSKKSIESIEEYREEGTFEVRTSSYKYDYRLVIDRFKAKSAPLYLSLDFGTTTSCVAIIRPNKEGKFGGDVNCLNTLPIDFFSPFWKLPSVIYKEGNKIISCGQEAIYSRAKPKPIKRLMITATPDEVSGYREDGKFIMETALRRTRDWLIEQHGVTEILFDNIILSVPTSFPLAWKKVLSEVCREAGKKVFGIKGVRIIEESMAAMNYYLYKQKGDVNYPIIIVCDFGGGSTDITIFERYGEGSYFPIKHGGMNSFASNQIDDLIKETFKERYELEEDKPKRLKENLDNINNFIAELKGFPNYDDIFTRNMWNAVQNRIKDEVVVKFSTCFKEMLQRGKNKWEKIQTDKILILLAGDGSNLVGFRDYIKRAWEMALRELQMSTGVVEIVQISEPKRCVSIGSFLAYYYHGEDLSDRKIKNDVPEDILLVIPPSFTPSNASMILDMPQKNKRYYRLFEEGQPLDKENKASVTVPLTDTGKNIVKENIIFHLFSGLVGDEPAHYMDLELIPPVDISMQNLCFTYKAEGPEVKIEWVK
jgi:actin-like ATPase involved in cell morphogenesis